MEEDWTLISEAELDPVSSDDKGMAQLQEQEKKQQLEVQEEAVKKEREEREAATWKAQEAAEVWADAEWRALEERLWDVVAQCSEMAVAPPQVVKPGGRMSVVGPSIPGRRASGVQDPYTWCHNKGTLCILGMAKGKTMACEACHHMKVSCSWMKRMAGEAWKKKVLMATLDMLSTEFYEFQRDYWGFGREVLRAMDTIAQELKRANNLKEKEMGKAKGKGKEKEEGPRRGRMEDKDGDMEMGRAGPSSLL
ncbi:hypothetical protein ID866_11070 [Astraeus odoratus]|nr:hypothetical protein ID866_11070 [Astraeus odoratus]